MKPARILMVDDHPGNLKLLSFILTKLGHEVRVAMDAAHALRVLDEFRPRLILMDLQLPGMDGLELTRRLKANPLHQGIVIVAVTASAMKGDEQRAKEAGCDGYITKPIDTRLLPELVQRYLDRHARANS
jgi:CheY-like chemotaxis protein